MGITYGMYVALHKTIYDQKDSRKRVIKFIPYQVSITITLMGSVLIIKAFIESEIR